MRKIDGQGSPSDDRGTSNGEDRAWKTQLTRFACASRRMGAAPALRTVQLGLGPLGWLLLRWHGGLFVANRIYVVYRQVF